MGSDRNNTHKITINNVNYQYKKNFRLIVNSRVSKNICSFPHIHILLKNLLINLCLCIKQCQIFERSNLISIYKFLQLSMHSGIYILHTLSIGALVRTGCSKSGVILIYNRNTNSQITVNQESSLQIRAQNLL